MAAEAGPSTPSGFFPAPFRVSEYHRPSTPYRSSTPATYSSPGPGYLPPRFRSSSVVSRSGEDETLRSQRFESVQRLKSTWELLAEKYGSVQLEDDDEVDILSGRVVRDRGRLRSLDRRDFGEISENEHENEVDTETDITVDGGSKRGDPDEEDGEDQDELGEWGERSGLDVQTPAPEERPPEPRWTEEDEEDLQSFLREEAKRRTVTPGEGSSGRGRRGSGEHGSEADWESEEDPSDREIPFVISPRRHGTRVYNELEDLFPEDEDVSEASAEESEDELLGMDEEATRKTPAPRSPSPKSRLGSKSSSASSNKSRLEVVIPVRSPTVPRSMPVKARRDPSTAALSAAPRPRPQHSPHSPPASPTRELITAPPSPRSLFPTPPRQLAESLFPTPPRQLAPAVVSHRPAPARAPSRPSLPPSSPPRQVSSPIPKRPRHVHVHRSPPAPSRPRSTPHPRPRPSLPPSSPPPQYFDTMRDPSPSPLPDIFTSPPQTRSQGSSHAESVPLSPKSGSSTRSRRASSSVGPLPELQRRFRHNTPSVRALERMATEVPRDDIDLSIYHPTMHFSNTGGINRCPRCRDAGGERLEKSPYCKGRHGGDRCVFEPKPPPKRRGRPPSRPPDSSESETPLYSPLATMQQNRLATRGAAQQETNTKTKGRRRLTDPGPAWRQRSNDAVGSVSAPESLAQSTVMALPEPAKTKRGRLVKRRDDVESGIQSIAPTPISAQTRTENRERARPRRTGQPPVQSDGMSGTPAPSQSSQRRGRAPRGAADSVQVAPLTTNPSGYESDDLESIADDEASPFVARMRERASAQQAQSSIRRPAAAQNAQSNVHRTSSLDRPLRALSTGSLHTTAASRLPHVSATVQDMAIATSSSSASRRRVDPPNASNSEASATRLGSTSRRQIRPLPGPSHRPVPIGSSIANHRTAVTALHFTPSPSSTGHRSASISSDHIPLSLPGKSILRRPSDASSSDVSRTIKRARFSLQPRSQGREYSSDPFNSSHAESADDHDLPLFDSSPIRPFPSSSPARGYASASSSSPFSREISLRAADVGLDLGPGHTGRLPSHLVRALAPSVRSAMVPSPLARPSTLGSSITTKSPIPTRPVPAYALPTPPPSIGSTTSTSTTFTSLSSRRTASPHAAGVGAGLMLPPPVPIKRRSSLPRLHTPLTPEPRVIPITILPSTAPPRTRSRSVSVAPTPHETLASKQPPLRSATTPRKRTRSEMDLQRLAEQIGDDAGYEWGMDEDAGEEVGRLWREGSVVRYVDA